MIDVGTLARIRSGEIAVRKGVESFDGPEVGFADGTRESFDAVVLATGFRAELQRMLPEHGAVFDQQGAPLMHGSEAAPGLYFCGYDPGRAGLLRQIGIEARRIGSDIAAAR